MTSPIEDIIIKCPSCGKRFKDWWRASINLKMDKFDDEYLESVTVKTCPHCHAKVKLGTMIVDDDGVWHLGQDQEGTAKSSYPTIRSLVFDFVHSCGGTVDYAVLTEQVKTHFPESRWKRSHWAWFRGQILHGRFTHLFSAAELAAIAASKTTPDGRATNSGETPARPQVIEVTSDMLAAVEQAIGAARVYEQMTDGRRKLGLTGEVGEVLCCHLFGLKLCADPRSQGFDALDSDGKRIQIKTRRSESEGLPRDAGRLSTFSAHDFDYALLVLLDVGYRVAEVWRAEHANIAEEIAKEKRRNPSLSAFKRKATLVWPSKQQPT